jgi:hypothetical protein
MNHCETLFTRMGEDRGTVKRIVLALLLLGVSIDPSRPVYCGASRWRPLARINTHTFEYRHL